MNKSLYCSLVKVLCVLMMMVSIAGCQSNKSSSKSQEVTVTKELKVELEENQEAEGK